MNIVENRKKFFLLSLVIILIGFGTSFLAFCRIIKHANSG